MSNKIILSGLAVVIAVLVVSIVLIYQPLNSEDSETREFLIPPGHGSYQIAQALEEAGLIRSRRLFIVYAIFVGKEKSFLAGRYPVSPAMHIPKIVELFSQGLAIPDDIGVTIPEGTNISDMVQIMLKAGLPQATEILHKNNLAYEGILFPDTYRFARDASVNEILQVMIDNFVSKAGEVLNPMNPVGDRYHIILASILEKEVQTEADMKLVSGIIKKRLKLGMPLEIDATITYGVCYLKFLEGVYCDVSKANIVDNLSLDSVYNTYKNKGLPETAISNPGLKALQAAVQDQESDYLYYLSAEDGTTIFSKTATEHARNRKKYLYIN